MVHKRGDWLSANAVCAQLQAEYDVEPQVCRTEVEIFLRELVKHGVVTLDSAFAPAPTER
jgi:uncharacterized protein YpbB